MPTRPLLSGRPLDTQSPILKGLHLLAQGLAHQRLPLGLSKKATQPCKG